MISNNHLGIYFGLNGLHIAELQGRKLSGYYNMSYQPGPEDLNMQSDDFDAIKLTATLQKALRDNRIEAQEAFISLPTKEFIMRTFSLSPLARKDLPAAVEFEVRKYIPFKVEEVFFDFQVSRATEGKAKKLKVLFLGIKKSALERYIYILQQSGLRPLSLEPHAVSLLRLLLMQKSFSVKQTTVVIEVNLKEATIMLVEQGLPRLIRDFRLGGGPADNSLPAPTTDFDRLLSEIRLSLEYYRRQNPKGIINKLLIVSDEDLKGWADNLGRELDIATAYVPVQNALGVKDSSGYGLLAAYGAVLANSVKMPLEIDLAKKRFRPEEKIAKALKVQIPSRKEIVRSGAIALAFVILVFFLNVLRVSSLSAQLNRLKPEDKTLASLSAEELKSRIDNYEKRIYSLREISIVDQISPKIFTLPLLLPEGVWLTALNLNSNGATSQRMGLKGIACLLDVNVEMGQVNKFVLNLKQATQIGKDFSRISLVSAVANQSPDLGGTSFEIICER